MNYSIFLVRNPLKLTFKYIYVVIFYVYRCILLTIFYLCLYSSNELLRIKFAIKIYSIEVTLFFYKTIELQLCLNIRIYLSVITIIILLLR